MQALLVDVPLPALQLLRRVTENAIEGGDDLKFRTLKRSNETCRTKIIDVPAVLTVMQTMGWTLETEGLVYKHDSLRLLEAALPPLDVAISEKQNATERDYDERKSAAAARAAELEKRHLADKERKEAELKKIKSIQSDVRDRQVKASHADITMGRSAAAHGIFAGAGGSSSSAKTFKDIGVSLNE